MIARALLLILGLLFAANAAKAGDSWTATEKQREAAFFVLHAIDWAQTRHIAKHPDEFYERNPFLGEHPSTSKVNRYFALTAAAHFAFADWLPRSYRGYFQYFTIGYAASTVVGNYNVGVKMDF